MANILSWLGNAAKGVGRQLNTFDNGATYKQQTAPQGPVPGSLASQAAQVPLGVAKSFGNVVGASFDAGQLGMNNLLKNKQAADISRQKLGNAFNNSIVGQVYNPAASAFNAVAQTPISPTYNTQQKFKQQQQQILDNIDKMTNQKIQEVSKGIKSGQIDRNQGAQAIQALGQNRQVAGQMQINQLNKQITDAGFKPNDSTFTMGRKFVSNAGQTVANALSLGTASGEAAAVKQGLRPALINATKTANYTGLANALSATGQDQVSGKSLIKDYGRGFGQGAVLAGIGGGAGLLAEHAPAIVDKTTLALSPKYNGLTKSQIVMDPAHLNILNEAKGVIKGGPDVSTATRQAVIDGLHQIKNQYGHDFVTGNANERVQKINQFLEQNGEAIPKLQNRLMSNEVGSVGKDVRPKDPLIQEYAGMLKSMGEGNGVSITKDGKRVSNNVRTADTKGLSKVDWYAEAEKQVKSGKADPAFMDYYNEMNNPEFQSLAAIQAAATGKSPLGETISIPSPETVPTPKIGVSETPKLSTKEYIAKQTKLQEEAAGSKSRFSGVGQALNTKMVDALNPIQKPITKALGGSENAYKLRDSLDRSLKSDSIAGQFAKDNGFHEIVKNLPDTKAFDQYVIAKHSADLEANGIKTGRNGAQDAQLVRDLAPKYETQAKVLSDYNNKLLDKTVEYGLISKETGNFLKEKYPNYVPFDRIFSDSEMQNMKGNGAGPASLSTQTVVQRIKGSDRQVHSPLESILAKTHDVIAQGERNQAAKSVISSKDLPGNPLSLKELKPGEKLGNRSSISYLENGEKKTFLTTPEVAAAAKSLNKEQMNVVQKILSYPTRALRLGATGINVGFTAANVTKDLASAFINSKHPVESSLANPRVFMKALDATFRHEGGNYAELVREGAGGTSFDIARGAAKDTIKKIRSERNVGTKALYTVTHPGELLRAVEDTIGRSEEFGRAMQYYGNKEAALKAGKSASDAVAYGADAARNNTVNFARAGEYGRVLNSVLPYFNAGIQGSRTLLTNIKEHPIQTGSKIAIASFLPVAATTAWNIGDPKRKQAYDDIQEYEKQGNIIIVPPNPHKDASGRWNVIKIPVSQEVANLNNIVRNGVETLKKDASFNFAQMAGDLSGTATSLNLQSPRQTVGQITPQAIKPAVEALTNQNLFTGNQIVPDKLKNLDQKDQVGKNTSGTAKTIGKVVGTSPLQVDNFLKTSFGGAGQNAVNFSDQALAKLGVIKPEDVKGRTIDQSITNRFTSAQGQPEYAGIDKALSSSMDQLKSLPAYKALSTDEKAKALNRLQGDVVAATKQSIDAKNNTGQYAQGYTGKQTKLSTKQAGLLNGKTDISSYLTASTSGGKTTVISDGINPNSKKILSTYDKMDTAARNKYFNSSNDGEYKYKQAKYENDSANGILSKAQDARAKYDLMQAKVGSNYSKETRDLYSLSKTQLYGVLSADPNGGGIAKQVLAYGDDLANAGLGKNKFKDSKGNISLGASTKSSGAGSAKGTSLKSKKFTIPKMKTAKAFKTPTFRVKTTKVAQFKPPKIPYNGISVKTPKVTRKAIA